MQRDSDLAYEVKGQWLGQRKGQVAFLAPEGRKLLDKLFVLGDRRVDADVVLEGGKVKEDQPVAIGWHAITNTAGSGGDKRFDPLLDGLELRAHLRGRCGDVRLI